MHRGARRAPIFTVEDHCLRFLQILGEVVDRFAFEIHAYSLMPNHYHLLVRTPEGNLSRGMRHLNSTYTQWLNRNYDWDGPVFRGRFKSQLIEDEEHLRYLLAYIHLNPMRAHLIKRLSSFGWTSHRAYTGREMPHEWLCVDVFLELFGGPDELEEFVRSVHRGKIVHPEDFDPDTGLFRKKAIARKGGRRRAIKVEGPQRRGLIPPERVLARVRDITGASQEDLMCQELGPRANPARRFAIWALYRSSGLTHRELGEILDVPYGQVANLLSRMRRQEVQQPVRGWMDEWLAGE